MKKLIIVTSLICFLIIASTVPAISINISENIEKVSSETFDNYQEYAGYMSIAPGTLEEAWEDYELTVEMNPDFGGEESSFSIKHNSIITFTADYEIKYDSLILPERWSFTLYIYGYKNDALISVDYDNIIIDDFDGNDGDDKTTGHLGVDINWDDYDQILANLSVSYWRPPWEGSKMEFGATEKTDIIILENIAPNTPTIIGESNGNIDTDYEYVIFSEDYENDRISYYIEWGDGETEDWSEYYDSGEAFTINHNWSKKGNYEIKVKARDEFEGKESNWAVMPIKMPKAKEYRNTFLERLFDLFSFDYKTFFSFLRH